MNRVDPFVAEVAVDFIHAVQAADHQPFQIEFRSNPQIQVHVERIVVGHKGPRGRPSQDRMHHGRFHFHVPAFVEEVPEFAHDLRPPHENFARAFVDDQVQIATPESLLYVRQAMPFLGQRQQSFAQKLQALHPYRQLVGLGAEEMAGNADDVAQIEQLK